MSWRAWVGLAGDGIRSRATSVVGLALMVCATSLAWARFEPVTCKNATTEDQEIEQGKQYALQVYGQQPVLPENDPVTVYVQQLGAKLVKSAPLAPGVTTQWPFSFHVVASDEVNAFALPGGAIFINLGTIQAAETEAQLAGVMGHEISHVVMRHSSCNQMKQKKKSMMYGLGSAGASMGLGHGSTGELAQKGIGTVQGLDFLHMSRDDEKQADLLGVGILYDSEYDTHGLPQFFQIIQTKYGSGGHQFLSDHPNPGNRQEYVSQEIAALPTPRMSPVASTPAFTKIHTTAMGEKALGAAEVKAGAWRSSGLYAAQPGANGR